MGDGRVRLAVPAHEGQTGRQVRGQHSRQRGCQQRNGPAPHRGSCIIIRTSHLIISQNAILSYKSLKQKKTPNQYLVKNYNEDHYVRWLLDNTRIHILPSLNPDGFEVAREGTCQGGQGRCVHLENVIR